VAKEETGMNPLVSVIIPTYNVERYIEEAINSVLKQTFAQFEIIVVDDGSSDQTVPLVQRYNDPRIQLHINEQNSGPSFTRNRAMELAQGEWVALLDSDDWWEETRLEKLLAAVTPDTALVADDFFWIVDGETVPYNTYFKEKNLAFTKVQEVSLPDMITWDLGPLKPMFRKSFLTQHRIKYRNDVKYGEDFLLVFECLARGGNMLLLPEAYYYRRHRAGSLMTREVLSTERLIDLSQSLIHEVMTGQFQTLPDKEKALAALHKRLRGQQEALLYNQIREPFNKGRFGYGVIQLIGMVLRKPSVLGFFMRRIPGIVQYRVIRRFRE
jgi:succinoglycan biosynthesis protein ExoO